jgi:hypothetical protein
MRRARRGDDGQGRSTELTATSNSDDDCSEPTACMPANRPNYYWTPQARHNLIAAARLTAVNRYKSFKSHHF